MLDNFRSQRFCSLFDLPPEVNYNFSETDITDGDIGSLIEGSDVVIHLAAITDAAGSFDNSEETERVNFQGTVRVANACIDADCPMIHMSSTSVYGTQSEVVDEDCDAEDLNPQSPYAKTKLMEEQYLDSFEIKSKLRYVILRFGTIAGVSPGMRFHTAVNKFCLQSVLGQPITVWTTALHQKRPYLSLEDAMRAYEHIIQERMYDGSVYNVVTSNMTVNEVINHIRSLIPDVSISFVENKIMNQLSYEVLTKKIEKKGFTVSGSIEENIEETINLFRSLKKASTITSGD